MRTLSAVYSVHAATVGTLQQAPIDIPAFVFILNWVG